MDSKNLIDAIVSGDKAAAKSHFNDVMQGKMLDSVSSLKAGVAQTMFNKATVNDEIV